MRNNTSYAIFSILRSIFCGNRTSSTDKLLLTEFSLAEVIKLAEKHDIAHIVAYGVINDIKDEDIKQQLRQIVFRAVYRYESMNYAFKQVCEILEQAEIPFIPLKGAVIRQYYPEQWMRTSCDIDILVYERDSEKAKSVLVDEHGYTYHGKESHDISLFSPSNIHIELHYNLIEDGRVNDSSNVLKKVWDDSRARDGYAYWHDMSDEMFYFYHIAHMAKHFENGGCGIRPFIDLWILDGIQDTDISKRDELLQQGNLLKFANVARKLSRIWFLNEKYDYISQLMEDYILRGGVYGNNENRITVQQQKKGGRIKYALSKIFIPYDVIKFHYPILQKHRWVTPFMEVRRWFKLLFCGHAKRSIRELLYNSNISQSQADVIKFFLDEIGL